MSLSPKEFVNKYRRYAYRACSPHNYNELFMLAQCAFESGWSNEIHTKIRALAGITTGGNWRGATYDTGKVTLRVYPNWWDSFDDHAGLFYRNRNGMYAQVHNALQGNSIEAFANAVAYSPYITELNGDNRPAYAAGIISCYNQIKQYEPILGFVQLDDLAVMLGLAGVSFGFYKMIR